MDGIKTGYTRMSGFNLLTSVKTEGRHVVAVVLGGRSAAARDRPDGRPPGRQHRAGLCRRAHRASRRRRFGQHFGGIGRRRQPGHDSRCLDPHDPEGRDQARDRGGCAPCPNFPCRRARHACTCRGCAVHHANSQWQACRPSGRVHRTGLDRPPRRSPASGSTTATPSSSSSGMKWVVGAKPDSDTRTGRAEAKVVKVGQGRNQARTQG